MRKNCILLSGGTLFWCSLKQAIAIATSCGYDGIEFLPFRKVIKEVEHIDVQKPHATFIKGIHHSWRLDVGLDSVYGVPSVSSLFFTLARYIFFPSPDRARKCIAKLSKFLNLPVTAHDIKSIWTHDTEGKEFTGGIMYEIFSEQDYTPRDMRKWLREKKHKLVLDTRDDQSLAWAKKQGFKDWKVFWEWVGIKKIGNVQLTLIGANGLRKIFQHKPILAQEQLLWLHNRKWKGTVTVEVNPVMLFFLSNGNFTKGLETISSFVKKTVLHGEKWFT